MRQNTLTIKQSIPKLLALSFLFLAFLGCKKTDRFYETLKKLPQINSSPLYAYKTAYLVGDTMVITGSLQPQNNLQITIGGITAAIVKTTKIEFNATDSIKASMDQVSLLITQEMKGKTREVKIVSGGYSIAGAAIDVYNEGGPGSFTDSLKAVAVKNFSSDQNIFLYCVNGKGDVYYYAPDTEDLRHLKKDGSEEILYDLSKSIGLSSNVFISSFLAGGVDPQGQNLYFSVQTDQNDYRFLQLNVQNNTLSILNQSTVLAAPYEGNIANVNVIVSGIYPDSKGNLYLTVANAIVRYTKEDGRLAYIYKQGATSADMPGTTLLLKGVGHLNELKFSPDENLVYALETDGGSATFEIFDLSARVLLQSFATGPGQISPLDVIAPFSGLNLNLGNIPLQPDFSFGYLPMPGKRLQTLLYQSTSGFINHSSAYSGFPKWIVFDFNDQRSYAYAPGRFNQGKFVFQPTDYLRPMLSAMDILLNYDEDGNLYMTTNGKAVIIKTQTIN